MPCYLFEAVVTLASNFENFVNLVTATRLNWAEFQLQHLYPRFIEVNFATNFRLVSIEEPIVQICSRSNWIALTENRLYFIAEPLCFLQLVIIEPEAATAQGAERVKQLIDFIEKSSMV